MEVTRENFLKAFPEIETAINECEFLAIDGEFTGLGTSLPGKVVFDTPAQRYERLKKGLGNHIIIQFGICTFKWDQEAQRYEAKPFNIYVFPRSDKGNEIHFQCQSSSIEFLASQGFDFNKLFYKGLSYMTPSQEARMRKKMETYCGKNDNEKTPKSNQENEDVVKVKSPMFVPPSMKCYVDDICSQIGAFIANEDVKVLDLAKASSFRRKLIYNFIEERYQSKFHVQAVEDDKGEKHIQIVKADEEEKRRLKAAKDEAKMAEFETAVGFFKIAKLLSESKKVIAGHNMLLDLMLTVGQFFTSLPDTLDEFKELLQTLFPKLVDTKLLSSSKPLKEKISNTSLGNLYQFLGENFDGPDVVFSEGFEDYHENSDKFHEAGYDAYCTGVCFAKMASYLCKMQHPSEDKLPVDFDAELVKAFINRVYVMRINGLIYITIDGQDEIPERKNVFHLEFPSTWRYSEINQLFNDFGNIYIAFINETSAFVSLDEEEQADEVIKRLIIEKESSECRVITYRQYIGMDALDMYDGIKIPESKQQQAESKKNYNAEGDESLSAVNGRQAGKSRKRALEEGLEVEEGEVVDIADSPSAEIETVVVAKKAKKEKKNTDKIASDKDFYEPDDW